MLIWNWRSLFKIIDGEDSLLYIDFFDVVRDECLNICNIHYPWIVHCEVKIYLRSPALVDRPLLFYILPLLWVMPVPIESFLRKIGIKAMTCIWLFWLTRKSHGKHAILQILQLIIILLSTAVSVHKLHVPMPGYLSYWSLSSLILLCIRLTIGSLILIPETGQVVSKLCVLIEMNPTLFYLFLIHFA